jgi:2-oxoglutarate ferredoxin oxidoreductase subunit alpha
MPELGRAFVQAESELGAINMVYGAACTGARVMSSSSSPGTSLMMEGFSYIAGTEIPAVMVNVMRGGPGLGNLAPSQGDYNQVVHGGGHGDYKPIVLAPASVQESIDLMVQAFDIAEYYRNIVFILTDGTVGQMMEPAELPPMKPVSPKVFDWAVNGVAGRPRRHLSSIRIDPVDEEKMNMRLMARWLEVKQKEVRYKEYYMDDAKIAVVGFGSAGRMALSGVRAARAEGIPVGLIRPISLCPFPEDLIKDVAKKVDQILVVEMNAGQMLNDVIIAAENNTRIEFYGRMGGMVALPDEIHNEIVRMTKSLAPMGGHPRDRWLERALPNFL